MINLDLIKHYFPKYLQDNTVFQKYFLKEYLQVLILDYLSNTAYIQKIAFIGGTNLRLIKGIDRFSEDLDFDCKDLSKEEFLEMTDNVIQFLNRNGFHVMAKDRKSDKLQAFSRNIHFPQLLFDLELTGHKEERFLIKIEAQDQNVNYRPIMVNIKSCGFFFPFPAPPDDILCAMKLSALLSRKKGRDFYDAIFLLSQTKPNYMYLSQKCGIKNVAELKNEIYEVLKVTDLNQKMKDFEHLLFNKEKSNVILRFKDFIDTL
jgi:predicted nucleotidyltransferase component of viral defense system